MTRLVRIALFIVALLTPLLILTTSMRIALSPIFYRFEYNLPNFPEDSYGTLIAQIPEATWKKLLEVESLSTEEFKEGLFYSNLPAVLDSGNVGPWVDTILKEMNKKEVAIGGDTYGRTA